MKAALLLVACLITATAALPSFAQETSPVGVWKSIDDKTGKPKATIRISEQNGEFTGHIEKLHKEPSEDQHPKCDLCEGELKDKPITGMVILTGMKRDGDRYSGGLILDPSNGKTYKSTMALREGGSRLEVRGYVGAPMFGRTQIWVRQP